jgi:hypothetical protein
VLEVLRQSHPSDYFQSVSVSSRVIGAKSASWRFDVDLAVIGIDPDAVDASDVSNSSDPIDAYANGTNGNSNAKNLSSLNGWGRRYPALTALDSGDSSLVPLSELSFEINHNRAGNGLDAALAPEAEIPEIDRWQQIKKYGAIAFEYLQNGIGELLKFRWLVTVADHNSGNQQQSKKQTYRLSNNDLGLITCTTSLVVGLAATLVIDRSLVGIVEQSPEVSNR